MWSAHDRKEEIAAWRDLPPLAVQAATLCLGTALGARLTVLSPPQAVALLAAVLSLGGRWGRMGVGLAVGLVAASTMGGRPLVAPQAIDLERPVVVSGVRASRWEGDDVGWSAVLRARTCRQGARVVPWRGRLRLRVYGSGRPPRGTQLRARGFVRRSPGLANRPPLSSGRLQIVAKSSRMIEAAPSAGGVQLERSLGRVRGWIRSRAGDAEWSSVGGRVVRALILGERDAIQRHWQRGLRRLGLSHLLALSGLHVALVAGMLWFLTRGLGRTTRAVAAGLGVAAYLVLAGARPALLRASLMALAALVSLWLRRPPIATAAFGMAAIALLVSRPDLVLDLGLQLTLAATAGLLIVAPRLEVRWARVPKWLRRPLAATVTAQVITAPWILPNFHLFTPLAPLANLVAVPWMSLTLFLALAWTVTASIHPALGEPLMAVLNLAGAAFSWPAALPAWLLWNQPLAIGPWRAWAASTVVLWALLRWPARRLAPLFLIAWLGLRVLPGAERGAPELVMIDVGQGDSLLLRSRGGAVLVDGGGWRRGEIGGRVLLPVLADLGVRRLEAVVMTHPDSDHCRGLVEIAAYLPVEEVWLSPGWSAMNCAVDLETLPSTTVRPLWRGAEVVVGRWAFKVLHPPPGSRRGVNDRSLVLMAQTGAWRVLLAGDLEAAGERGLVAGGRLEGLEADVLKVAHHGSRGSSTTTLLEAVRPRLSLVSVGASNLYGHPSPVALARIRGAGAIVVRSDRHGMVRLRFGHPLRIAVDFPGQPRP